VLKSS